ncbi:uncharacterized protein PADG_04944 [Paracoccidioides brasiliensis Pb18]|uniref:Uncharacterized protein n=1 Tax=Paracoccidioides brasiliensis (strain Pb18) TaxID=502780 RepID=C1GBE3_PARBD|nr:uncharacterized protein PADG_04944 [Paracoccidioides brasiliensis Pb18]EEH48865.2 hypothetical protein PADG_04944 [Paracoccidioides brasiliensis Pb18]ODH51404.1 hypothetical protein GX48_02460 [Paracoccidioides brasiliensis]
MTLRITVAEDNNSTENGPGPIIPNRIEKSSPAIPQLDVHPLEVDLRSTARLGSPQSRIHQSESPVTVLFRINNNRCRQLPMPFTVLKLAVLHVPAIHEYHHAWLQVYIH